MFRTIRKFVFQDVKNENETKKVSVILRLNAIIMFIYFMTLSVICFVMGRPGVGAWFAVCLLAYIVAFYITYLNQTKQTVIVTIILTLVWIAGFVRAFGMDCGIQHFIFALFVLYFATSYSSTYRKVLAGILFCLFRMGLFLYGGVVTPRYALGSQVDTVIQMVTTIFIFAAMTAILLVVMEDSQEMEKKLVGYNEKLHELASIDPLTGLLNRRSMGEYLEQKERECKEGKIDNLSLSIGDIDFFKKINDTYGHECGDFVLCKLADVFKEIVGEKGKISRWGGEEFLIVFNNINGDEALAILSQIQKSVNNIDIHYKEEKIKMTMTFGLSEFDFYKGVEYSINDVDEKLYKGKESGRNRIIY